MIIKRITWQIKNLIKMTNKDIRFLEKQQPTDYEKVIFYQGQLQAFTTVLQILKDHELK